MKHVTKYLVIIALIALVMVSVPVLASGATNATQDDLDALSANMSGLVEDLEALNATVNSFNATASSLKEYLEALNSTVGALQGNVSILQDYVVYLQDRMDAVEAALVKVPATFVYSDLIISPSGATVGQDVTVSIRVDNTGDLTGSYSATLYFTEVPDTFTYVPQTQTAALVAGYTRLTFIVSPTVAGAYRISLGGLSGAFEVKAVSSSSLPWWAYALVIIIAAIGVYVVIARGRKKEATKAPKAPKLSFKDSLKQQFLRLVNRFRKPVEQPEEKNDSETDKDS